MKDSVSDVPTANGNYTLIMCDGKDSFNCPLKDEGKPIIVGRSSQAGATIKVSDEGTSAQHLEIKWDATAGCWQAKVSLFSIVLGR